MRLAFHRQHESRYGPGHTCGEQTCVDAKLAIAWLQYRRTESLTILTSKRAPGYLKANDWESTLVPR
jgi:hypothetical protein